MPTKPINRRRFLTGAAASAAAVSAALVGTTGRNNAFAGTATDDQDFPVALPGPFAHGVASGDPLSDRVIIWTRVNSGGEADVDWSVATNPEMTTVVRSGRQRARSHRDYTVKVDVTGLDPATTYYYRFSTGGKESITGRTRTAPGGTDSTDGTDSPIRLAVMSCTSYWSSWWSGLGHLARRNDIDLVVHLGDYVYDFIDKDEQVRSKAGFDHLDHPDNRDWLTVDECRRRYALHRSDPNLVRAHQQHPWSMIWDNHDLDVEFGNELEIPGMEGATSQVTVTDTARVFHEWTPTRPPLADGSGEFAFVEDGSYPEPEDPLRIYRSLRFGGLADVILTDGQSHLPTYGLPTDSSHLSQASSVLGRDQFEWLDRTVNTSDSDGVRWRIIGNQTVMAPIDIPDLDVPGDLPKLGISRWADYQQERDRIVDMLPPARNIVLSGDTHCNVAADLTVSPLLTSPSYTSGPAVVGDRPGAQSGHSAAGAVREGSTSWGSAAVGSAARVGGDLRDRRSASAGVEFAPSSMGRGGADDQIAGVLSDGFETVGSSQVPESSVLRESQRAASVAEVAIANVSPNIRFIDWCEHGYGVVDVSHERAVFEWWWQNKFETDSPDVLGYQYITWAESDSSSTPPRHVNQIDDVRWHGQEISATSGDRSSQPAPEPARWARQ